MTRKEVLLRQLRELEEEEREQKEQEVPGPTRVTLTRTELAEYLRVDPSTIAAHHLPEKIPHMKIGKRQIYRLDIVDWYMTQAAYQSITDPALKEEFKREFITKPQGGTDEGPRVVRHQRTL